VSNYDLKAEANRLQSQLNDIQRANNQLRSEINAAVQSVNQADRDLQDYNQRIRDVLDSAVGKINNSVNRALDAYELQGQIDRLYVQFKNMELANKKIRTLNNKKYYDFNNYRTVRKIVKGMMDNLDLNMVSEPIIYKAIERQHLLTPDYWLTCALISIMAWRADDRMLAERAIETACKLDVKNSSMFYMIFNMRMDRNEAAIKWFLQYQRCELKGSDAQTFLMLFSLISSSISDVVDDETERLIADYIHGLIAGCMEKEGYEEETVITEICNHFQSFYQPQSYELPLMAKYCRDYSSIALMLGLAQNNSQILEYILKVVNVTTEERNTYLKEYLNELLESPNEVEIGTYNEIEYNEMIIAMKGDVENAKLRFDAELIKRASDFNIIATIVEWLFDLGNEHINGQMRLNMFTLVKTFQEKAAKEYFEKYRAMFKTVHPVTINDYSTDMDLADEGKENVKINNYCDDLQKAEMAQVKNLPAYLIFGLGGVCAVASPFVSLYLLVVTVLCGALGGIKLAQNAFQRKNITLKYQKMREGMHEILHKLVQEFEKMKGIYKEFDDVSGKIEEELAKL